MCVVPVLVRLYDLITMEMKMKIKKYHIDTTLLDLGLVINTSIVNTKSDSV